MASVSEPPALPPGDGSDGQPSAQSGGGSGDEGRVAYPVPTKGGTRGEENEEPQLAPSEAGSEAASTGTGARRKLNSRKGRPRKTSATAGGKKHRRNLSGTTSSTNSAVSRRSRVSTRRGSDSSLASGTRPRVDTQSGHAGMPPLAPTPRGPVSPGRQSKTSVMSPRQMREASVKDEFTKIKREGENLIKGVEKRKFQIEDLEDSITKLKRDIRVSRRGRGDDESIRFGVVRQEHMEKKWEDRIRLIKNKLDEVKNASLRSKEQIDSVRKQKLQQLAIAEKVSQKAASIEPRTMALRNATRAAQAETNELEALFDKRHQELQRRLQTIDSECLRFDKRGYTKSGISAQQLEKVRRRTEVALDATSKGKPKTRRQLARERKELEALYASEDEEFAEDRSGVSAAELISRRGEGGSGRDQALHAGNEAEDKAAKEHTGTSSVKHNKGASSIRISQATKPKSLKVSEGTKAKSRRGHWKVALQHATILAREHRVEKYKDDIDELYSAAGVDDIDKVVDRYLIMEDDNIKLFTILNSRCEEIERLTADVESRQSDIAQFLSEENDSDMKWLASAQRNNASLAQREQVLQQRYNFYSGCLKQSIPALRSMFHILGCKTEDVTLGLHHRDHETHPSERRGSSSGATATTPLESTSASRNTEASASSSRSDRRSSQLGRHRKTESTGGRSRKGRASRSSNARHLVAGEGKAKDGTADVDISKQSMVQVLAVVENRLVDLLLAKLAIEVHENPESAFNNSVQVARDAKEFERSKQVEVPDSMLPSVGGDHLIALRPGEDVSTKAAEGDQMDDPTVANKPVDVLDLYGMRFEMEPRRRERDHATERQRDDLNRRLSRVKEQNAQARAKVMLSDKVASKRKVAAETPVVVSREERLRIEAEKLLNDDSTGLGDYEDSEDDDST